MPRRPGGASGFKTRTDLHAQSPVCQALGHGLDPEHDHEHRAASRSRLEQDVQLAV